ncbi:hypothetical protein ScPMuIL_009887 [Solemya velum]
MVHPTKAVLWWGVCGILLLSLVVVTRGAGSPPPYDDYPGDEDYHRGEMNMDSMVHGMQAFMSFMEDGPPVDLERCGFHNPEFDFNLNHEWVADYYFDHDYDYSSNGMPPNGMPPNGMPPTGMPPTGMPPTGMPPTGMPPTGMPPNGTHWGDMMDRSDGWVDNTPFNRTFAIMCFQDDAAVKTAIENRITDIDMLSPRQRDHLNQILSNFALSNSSARAEDVIAFFEVALDLVNDRAEDIEITAFDLEGLLNLDSAGRASDPLVQSLEGLDCVLTELDTEIQALSADDKRMIAEKLQHKLDNKQSLGLDVANCNGFFRFMVENTGTRKQLEQLDWSSILRKLRNKEASGLPEVPGKEKLERILTDAVALYPDENGERLEFAAELIREIFALGEMPMLREFGIIDLMSHYFQMPRGQNLVDIAAKLVKIFLRDVDWDKHLDRILLDENPSIPGMPSVPTAVYDLMRRHKNKIEKFSDEMRGQVFNPILHYMGMFNESSLTEELLLDFVEPYFDRVFNQNTTKWMGIDYKSILERLKRNEGDCSSDLKTVVGQADKKKDCKVDDIQLASNFSNSKRPIKPPVVIRISQREGEELFHMRAILQLPQKNDSCEVTDLILIPRCGEDGDLFTTHSKGTSPKSLFTTLKVLYLTDTVAAVYHCVYEKPDGTCHPSAVISHILSRDPSVPIEEEGYLKNLLQQSGISVDHWKPVTDHCTDLQEVMSESGPESNTEERQPECQAFPAQFQSNLDLPRLEGYWFSVASTVNSKMHLSSFVEYLWVDDNGFLKFKTATTNADAACLVSDHGFIRPRCRYADNNQHVYKLITPGSWQFTPWVILYTDYDNTLVLYTCGNVDGLGQCVPDDRYVFIMSRSRVLEADWQNRYDQIFRDACIEPTSVQEMETDEHCTGELEAALDKMKVKKEMKKTTAVKRDVIVVSVNKDTIHSGHETMSDTIPVIVEK